MATELIQRKVLALGPDCCDPLLWVSHLHVTPEVDAPYEPRNLFPLSFSQLEKKKTEIIGQEIEPVFMDWASALVSRLP